MDRSLTLNKFVTEYKNRLNDLLNSIDLEVLEKVIVCLISAFKAGNSIYVCGNGGSAATASHIHADFRFFVRYFTKFRPKIFSLTDNVPLITAIGNDISFDEIFVEQLKGVFSNGDVVICISASGNSENVIRAAKFANENGGISLGFVGFDGGKLKETAKLSLYTPNAKGDYGPIEDLHMIFDHLIVNFLAQDEEFLTIS
jgi:D-sedoheptulose 7-phosphate isomerase